MYLKRTLNITISEQTYLKYETYHEATFAVNIQLAFTFFTQLSVNKAAEALLADSQQTLLDGVPLGFGERAAFGEPVDSLQSGVDQLRVVLRAGEESGTAGQQRQQGRADVPVHGQRGLRGAQHFLRDRVA